MDMKKNLIATAVLAAAMALPSVASAQARGDTGFYVGAEFGQTDLDGADKDTAFKFFGGYQFDRTFSAELGYTNLYDKDDVEATAWELVGVAKMPVANNLSVYGKLGFAMWEAEQRNIPILGTVKADGTDLTFAIGAQYDLNRNLGIRAQWQRYDVESDADVLSLGLVYRF